MSFIKFIYEEYRQDVFVYLVSLTRNSTLSEDLVSENSIRVIDFRHIACSYVLEFYL